MWKRTAWGRLGSAALLVLMTLAVYLPTLRSGYIWDDDYYVTRNFNLRSASGLRDLWLKPGAVPQYYPVTHTTFWIEYHLWGLRPLGYHLDNILLHAASVVMLWIILRKLAIPGAWLIAAIFAVHPIEVESVAWITERKNVLSGVFYFAALFAYWRSGFGSGVSGLGKECDLHDPSISEKPKPETRTTIYILSLVLFACSLLSKSVSASLPAVILLLVWWKHGRIKWRDVLPLLPMFVMGLVMGAVTSYMERTYVGAAGKDWDLSHAQRVLIAGRAIWFYVWKIIWPAKLIFIYPKWSIDPGVAWQWVYPAGALLVLAALWLLRRRIGRGPIVAALIFVGTLVPALGFVNVLPMRYSYVADHFQYIAGIALAGLIVAGLSRCVHRAGLNALWTGRVIAVMVLLVLALLTWRRQAAFADLRALWNDTLAKNPDAWMAQNNLAVLLMNEGKPNDAEPHLRAALTVNKDAVEVLSNLAAVEATQGHDEQAIALDERALANQPRYAPARVGLARLLAKKGHAAQSADELEQAIHDQPGYAPAYFELGRLLQSHGRFEEAVANFDEAARHDPDLAAARAQSAYTRGLIFASQQNWTQAATQFRSAIAIEPRLAEAYNNLGAALEHNGDLAGARSAYEKAVAINPSFQLARKHLDQLKAQH